MNTRLDIRVQDGDYGDGLGEWPDENGDPHRIVWDEDPSEVSWTYAVVGADKGVEIHAFVEVPEKRRFPFVRMA